MKQYLNLMRYILETGEQRPDRTGTGTRSLFGPQLEFDLTSAFPILTTKRVNFVSVVRELLWMIRGSTNVKDLHPCRIWDAWADEEGSLGPVYGKQWRAWELQDGQLIDQLQAVIEKIIENPWSRRHVVSAWNVGDLSEMRLEPCHILYQFYVGGETAYDEANGESVSPGFLDCKMYHRSADYFLGVPFNICQYALLTHIVAHLTGLKPRRLTITFGDIHLYENHLEQARKQLSRTPHEPTAKLVMPAFTTIDDYGNCDPHRFTLADYHHEGDIKAPISV